MKPLTYKQMQEHVRQDGGGATVAADGTRIYRPKYGPGWYLDNRLQWQDKQLETLRELIAFGATQSFSADVLGRPPKTLVNALKVRGIKVPRGWVGYEQRAKAKGQELMSYPYVTAARVQNSDVLAVNQLVARDYPEHMRADLCQDILLALLQGETTLEKLRARGIRAFVTQWRKVQREDEYWPSLDAPREKAHAWHEVLSEEHSVWLGQGFYVDTGPARHRKIIRPKVMGKREARARQEAAFLERDRKPTP